MSTLIRIVIAILVFWIIFTYLLPFLPEPINQVVIIILVIAAIIWLAKLAGINVG